MVGSSKVKVTRALYTNIRKPWCDLKFEKSRHLGHFSKVPRMKWQREGAIFLREKHGETLGSHWLRGLHYMMWNFFFLPLPHPLFSWDRKFYFIYEDSATSENWWRKRSHTSSTRIHSEAWINLFRNNRRCNHYSTHGKEKNLKRYIRPMTLKG